MCLGIPGKVTKLFEKETFRYGMVDFGGVSKEVNMDCVPEATIGDYVIVHVGFALSRIDEEEAAQVFKYLEEMNELDDLQDEERGA
jgi:hydrogenase expression/formation protein HypC